MALIAESLCLEAFLTSIKWLLYTMLIFANHLLIIDQLQHHQLLFTITIRTSTLSYATTAYRHESREATTCAKSLSPIRKCRRLLYRDFVISLESIIQSCLKDLARPGQDAARNSDEVPSDGH
jgi:hypothetical protein